MITLIDIISSSPAFAGGGGGGGFNKYNLTS
jgi:hypothetical protein